MSPKRHAFNVPESAAAKWRRLCPEWAPPSAAQVTWTEPAPPTTTTAPQRGARRTAAPPLTTAADYVTRADAPAVRHARRGTTTAAVAALAAVGSIALVESLLRDKHAVMTRELIDADISGDEEAD